MAALVVIGLLNSASEATVESNVQRTLKLAVKPIDLAVSLNGHWLFVLTEKGSVQVYTPAGQLEGEIEVGPEVDGIRVGPREDVLLLTSRQEKTIQIVSLDFIRPIAVAGSPFKGPADAPVVIAVFSDFE